MGCPRSPSLPNLPTTSEAGLPSYQASAWNALFAPKGTPKDIIDKLNTEVNKALKSQDVIERLDKGGNEIVGTTPEAFATLIKADLELYTKLINDAGIRPE